MFTKFGRYASAAAAFAAAALLAPMSLANASAYQRLVVFGDSLSDSGNAGRFSNGPVWVEYLARSLGLELAPARIGGTNYAVGGARTHGHEFSLRDQVDLFVDRARGGVGPDTLFVVYAGANDLRGAVHAADRDAVVTGAIAALRRALLRLEAAGAREALVPNLPDIGRTPEARMIGPGWVRAARALTMDFNARLARLLDEIEARGRLRIRRMDVFGLVEAAAADPGRFGFSDMTNPCPPDVAARGCDGYVFWDSMHPTTAGHARLAEAASQVLLAPAAQ